MMYLLVQKVPENTQWPISNEMLLNSLYELDGMSLLSAETDIVLCQWV